MGPSWDPETYLAYAGERGRPFVELLARIGAEEPRTVVDLGCGPGNLTALLADRWPSADVRGLDASPEMVAAARRSDTPARFEIGDLRTWAAEEGPPVDVLVSNATLQWLPGHLELLPALVSRVRPGGWFAFGVPGNFDEPSHTLRRDLAAEPAYAAATAGVTSPDAYGATTYLRALERLGCSVDAWETTYLHVLRREVHGDDPVFAWISGTSARPVLQALGDLRPAFEEELKRRLRAAYPDDGSGVVLPFRRIFVVARVPGPG